MDAPKAIPLARSSTFQREWMSVLGRATRTGRGACGLGLVIFVVLVAVIGPFLMPHSPTAFVTAPFAHPSREFLLGGDVLGRDAFARMLGGGRLLLVMAVVATVLGVSLGAVAGTAAAYSPGWPDGLIMRVVDIVLAFPQLVFALMLVSILGPKPWLIVVAVAISHIPPVARVARAAALDVSERDFVKAVEAFGVPRWRIIRQELMPNVSSVLMVEVGIRLTFSILTVAGLSFIGFGLQPPTADWGLMISENRIGVVANPWVIVVPALLIAALTIGTNMFTDAVARVSLGVESVAVAQVEAADPIDERVQERSE
jgi:peptide/nickel transport system permease protein